MFILCLSFPPPFEQNQFLAVFCLSSTEISLKVFKRRCQMWSRWRPACPHPRIFGLLGSGKWLEKDRPKPGPRHPHPPKIVYKQNTFFWSCYLRASLHGCSVTKWLAYFTTFAIYISENCPITKFAKLGPKFSQIVKNPQKMPKTLKILPKWRNFAKSGHTACLALVANEHANAQLSLSPYSTDIH